MNNHPEDAARDAAAETRADGTTPEELISESEMAGDEGEPAEVIEPTHFQKRIAAIPEKRWVVYQIVAGIAVGLLTVVTLFIGNGDFSYLFFLAVCLALIGPNYLERQGERRIPQGRTAMCITIAVGLVAILLIYVIQTNFTFTDPS